MWRETAKFTFWLPCTPQPMYTESSVFPDKAIQHAVIPVISFTWSSSTPSTNKISTFTESFDDAIDSVAMETNFSGYIPIWTSIPPISYNYSSPMWYHRTHIIISICRPSLVTVVLESREQLRLWRSRCTIRNSVQIGWNCTYGTENSWFPSVIYTKTRNTPANIPLHNVQKKR